ncbi:M15 family peptidase [Amphritea opalescens]|uniref:M15 family peptidase n=1 Tax=Amphritea opalescens TaxID=2490544 RepID=A0A430KVN0_9GAMM|nr:M15 family metallopeptidase [Amphritea opalescens]RTE67542.1 M15 family peptidase [Amphritea opalescens]
MKRSEIVRLQERVGTLGDGFWGPMSIAACQQHLKNLMPSPHPFPVEGSPEFIDFFGPHGDKHYSPPRKKIILPFTIYYGDKPVKSLWAHEKCADSLLRVFQRLAEMYPDQASRKSAGILVYNGLYNPRLKRNSWNSWSMHAWMNAIDINAGRNGNKTAWPVNASMPIEVMECFAKEGWLSAGAFWGRDAMHFQATAPVS